MTHVGTVFRVTITANSKGYGPYHHYFYDRHEAAMCAKYAYNYLPDYVFGGVKEVEVHERVLPMWRRSEMFPPGWAAEHLAHDVESHD